MKTVRFIPLIAAIALLLPSAMLARTKDEGKIQLSDPVQIGTTQLSPGNYTVAWTGTGPNVQVTFRQHKQIVATTKGTILERKNPSPYDDVVLKPSQNGNAKTIDEIDFNNRKEALRITPVTTAEGASMKD
jgi:hypothetical protein